MPFTAAEKAECAEREVKQRERVYPRLVQAGKMAAITAEYQIRLMKEIAADYRALESNKERLL